MSLVSSSGKRRKIDNNRRKKEAQKRTDEKEATKLNQRNLNKEYVFFVEFPLIQFSCLLLVCPLLCFFLPSVVVFLILPEEDLLSNALVCLYHRLSSIGECSFLLLFLTCPHHQQLLAFSLSLVRFGLLIFFRRRRKVIISKS